MASNTSPNRVRNLKSIAHPLREEIKKGRITLVLGAGLSYPRQLPTWRQLTESMWKHLDGGPRLPWVVDAEQQALLDGLKEELSERDDPKWQQFSECLTLQLNASANSLGFQMAFELMRARMNARHGPDHDRFADELRKLLYKGEQSQKMDTLAMLATIIRQEQESGDSRIIRVITFNVDDLLEREVHPRRSDMKKAPILWPVVRASSHIRRSRTHKNLPCIPCYHLHGYLPRDPEPFEDAPDTLIFTDAQYWASVANPLSFANTTMSHALHDSSCIFLGLSMTDINLIRWLGMRAIEVADDKRSQFSQALDIEQRFLDAAKKVLRTGDSKEEMMSALTEELDRTLKLQEKEIRKAQERSLRRHTWVTKRNDDRVLCDFLRHRGVDALEVDHFDDVPELLRLCFE